MIKRYVSDPLFLFFFFLGACSIIGSSYVGLNGDHTWRQSDVYAHIMGFMSAKGMAPLHDFLGRATLYDLPFYQFIVAKLALFTQAEPLVVVRYVDLLCWVVVMLAGGMMADSYQSGNRLYFWALATVSPLFLHYFATPLPDVMAVALSAAALALLMGDWGDERPSPWWPALLLALAALIKSPVPFVFLVYYFLKLVMERRSGGEAPFAPRQRIIYAVSFIAALGAELIRRTYLGSNVGGFAQDPSWYFGTIDLRLHADFWQLIWFRAAQAQPYAPLAFVLVGLMLFHLIRNRGEAARTLVPFVASFFAGWLTFSKVYLEHAYYQLPVTFMLFMAAAVTIGALINRAEAGKVRGKDDFSWRAASLALIIGAAPVLMIFGTKMSFYHSVSIFDSARFAFRETNHFLWVDEKDEGPAVGGVVATPFSWITPVDFETNCDRYVGENRAIMVKGTSQCLLHHRNEAATFIDDAGFQVFVRATP